MQLTDPLATDTLAPTNVDATPSDTINHLIRHLGCSDALPDSDGIYSLLLDDHLSLALWPDSTETFVIIAADVSVPAEMDLTTLHRAAMSFNLGAASRRAPILSLDAEARLVLAWTLPLLAEEAEAGVDYFLENLGMASSSLADSMLGGDFNNGALATEAASAGAGDDKDLVFSQIAQRLNVDSLSFDADGLCLLQTGEDKLIFVSSAPDDSIVTLGAEIASLQNDDGSALSLALAYNFSAVTNNSAALALDAANESLLLITGFSATATTTERIQADLESFFRAYASCLGQLLNFEHFEDLTAKEELEETEEVSLDFPAGSIRV